MRSLTMTRGDCDRAYEGGIGVSHYDGLLDVAREAERRLLARFRDVDTSLLLDAEKDAGRVTAWERIEHVREVMIKAATESSEE